jgi:hypothetical protein
MWTPTVKTTVSGLENPIFDVLRILDFAGLTPTYHVLVCNCSVPFGMMNKYYQSGGPVRKTVVKKTISIQPDVWEYISSQAKDNASAFINEALRGYRTGQLHQSMIRGYKAMASRAQIAEDLALWDTTLLDGLSDEDHPAR